MIAGVALGAEGMNMGTRFLATTDAPIHNNVKQAIVEADELQTASLCGTSVTPSG